MVSPPAIGFNEAQALPPGISAERRTQHAGMGSFNEAQALPPGISEAAVRLPIIFAASMRPRHCRLGYPWVFGFFVQPDTLQ